MYQWKAVHHTEGLSPGALSHPLWGELTRVENSVHHENQSISLAGSETYVTAQPPPRQPRGLIPEKAPSGRIRAWAALVVCSLITIVAAGLWALTGQAFLLGWGLGSLLLGVLLLRQL
ncbi:MAG: hypothetical protein CL878_09640 [Dehalococcoidia bacterium]|nr:hypothetical protein [Dehalococcoidia bacterium]